MNINFILRKITKQATFSLLASILLAAWLQLAIVSQAFAYTHTIFAQIVGQSPIGIALAKLADIKNIRIKKIIVDSICRKAENNLIDTSHTYLDNFSGNNVKHPKFMEFIKSQKIERRPSENIKVEIIANKWSDLPEKIRNYEPSLVSLLESPDLRKLMLTGGIAHYYPAIINVYRRIIDDKPGGQKKHHKISQRLPGGYHLSVDEDAGNVLLHYDAYDPLQDPIAQVLHVLCEVGPLKNGGLQEHQPENNNKINWLDWN
jgi:hypothetical protein